MKFLHHHAVSFLLSTAALVNAVPDPQYDDFLPEDYNLDTLSLQPPTRALDIASASEEVQLTELREISPAIQHGISISDNTPIQVARARRKNASGGCGLPICRGEASYYRFGPRDVVFCGSRGRHSSSAKIVALPAWFMNRSYCGKYLTLSRTDASGRVHTTRALIGDKCPHRSCVSDAISLGVDMWDVTDSPLKHRGNNRIDLSEAAFLALGGSRGAGVLGNIRWRIAG